MDSPAPRPKYMFFTDFDGTITLHDSNDHLSDTRGLGPARRLELTREVLDQGRPFREMLQAMLDSVTLPFPEVVAYLVDHVELDPHFRGFYHWCRGQGVPVVVLSGGMAPVIEAILRAELGDEVGSEIVVVSNAVEARDGKALDEEGGWRIVFRDESPHGHDKSIELRKYSSLPESERPVMFYAGDGVSDLSAAKETDLLFAKAGKDLIKYCEKQNMPFVTFEDWSFIHDTVKDIIEGRTTCAEVASSTADVKS